MKTASQLVQNNRRLRAQHLRERGHRIRDYLADHPGASRRDLLAAFRRRTSTGEALAALLRRGDVVKVSTPDRGALYLLKQHRGRLRLVLDSSATPSPGESIT